MRRLLTVALLAGCGTGTPIPETDLLLTITPGAFEVEPGEPFPLAVTRVWKRELDSPAWSDKALAPLALRLVEETRRDDGTRVEETRRYLAHAFSLKDVVVRGTKLVATPKGGGAERKVVATGFRIRVNPVLDPENPGPPELPGEPPPSRGWMWWGGGALALAAVLFLSLALRRRPGPVAKGVEPPSPPPPPLRERALDRLRGASVEEAADIVREYLAATTDVRALEMTTEELLRPLPALAAVFGPADLAKFAAVPPSGTAREAAIRAAMAFVREAAP